MGDGKYEIDLLNLSLDGLGDFDDGALSELALDFERAHGRIQVLQSAVLTELTRRRCVDRRKHRNERLWMADRLKLPTRRVGYRFNRAEMLNGMLARAAEPLLDGRIQTSHVDLLANVARKPRLADAFDRDLPALLEWAETEEWPLFQKLVEGWAEMMDPIDPAAIDDANLDARGLVWAQGLDREVMVQLNTTALCWEQVLTAAQPIYERMHSEEWDVAKAEHGELACGTDLVRSDKQRWHDAFVEVIHHALANLNAGNNPAAAGFDVGIVVDLRTLEDAAQRFEAESTGHRSGNEHRPGGATGEPNSRSADEAHQFRCETAHGLRVSAREALHATLAGTIRRITLNLPDLDFSVSKSKRLFRGPLRWGLMVRDRYCQHPGCDTPANRCEADHIKPVEHGGLTEPTNGQAQCPPCHRHKTGLQAEGLLPSNSL